MRSFAVLLLLGLAACGSSDDSGDPAATPADPTTTTGGTGTVTPGTSSGDPSPTPTPGVDDPGPKPTKTCTVTKDANGFFAQPAGSKGTWVGYVPPTYDGNTPVHLVVGLHGCGDTAQNFASWAVSPFDTRKKQEHIAISIGGRDKACWDTNADEQKIHDAIADITSCFWVHQQKIVLAGYSSGGILAYQTAMKNSTKFAGLIILNSGLYAAGGNEAALLSGATNKFPIAHLAHKDDADFPIAKVQPDWDKIKNAGFPIQTSITAGTHNGTSADWTSFLLPKVPDMKLP